ncbi:MAG TPA: CDP-diacylglycerol--serine O-phosphatidyltransferase [bacterium]|nr:CDP-diacylglycerol--serine O-phosphatidyltransferase [bacterium]
MYNKKKQKNVYILPNLFTSANFFCGIFSMILSLRGDFYHAAWAVMAAMLFDFLDGQVARLTKGTSQFGVEYDSLSDMVSFGIAPTIMMYLLALKDLNRIGIAIAFVYSVSCALRLARFNVSTQSSEKKQFTGMPTPAACGLLASLIILQSEYAFVDFVPMVPVIMLALAFLMVSNIKYPTLSSMNLKKEKPFLYLAGIVIATSVFIFHTELFIFVVFFSYAAYGVIRETHYYTLGRRYLRNLELERTRTNEK